MRKLYQRFLHWLYPELLVIQEKFEHNHKLLENVHTKLEEEINLIEKEMLFYKSIAEQMIEESPDMAWLKDVNGIYIMANDSIRKDLLCNCKVEGKNDLQLANEARENFGKKNHTFGEMCANSDKVVIDLVRDNKWGDEPNQGRFYEYGKVKGKMLYLEVNKFPVFVKGELYGVAGFGRDLTPYVEAYKESNCRKCTNTPDIFKIFEFNERG